MSIKQFRALQKACLELANQYKFLKNENWHEWMVLKENLPELNENFVETFRSHFKIQKKSKKAKVDGEDVQAPEAFSKRLTIMFQKQTSIVERRHHPVIAKQV